MIAKPECENSVFSCAPALAVRVQVGEAPGRSGAAAVLQSGLPKAWGGLGKAVSWLPARQIEQQEIVPISHFFSQRNGFIYHFCPSTRFSEGRSDTAACAVSCGLSLQGLVFVHCLLGGRHAKGISSQPPGPGIQI